MDLILEFFKPYIPTFTNAEKNIARKILIARAVFILSLIIPNLTLYNILPDGDTSNDSVMMDIQGAFLLMQTLAVVGSTFCSMFGHKFSNVNNNVEVLNVPVERRCSYFMFFFLCSKIFRVLTVVNYGIDKLVWNTIFRYVSNILFWIGFLQLIYLSLRIIMFLGRQTHGYVFKDSDQMSDFFSTIAVLCFVMINSIMYILSGATLFMSNAGRMSFDYLYVQISLVIFLQVMNGRCYMRAAEIKRQKLETRLNLIRYVSHEIRTPLNTAFMGLKLILGEISSMKKCVAVSMESLKIIYPEIFSSSKPFSTVQIPDDVTFISNRKARRRSIALATGEEVQNLALHTNESAAVRCAKSLDTNTCALENVLETTTLINDSCNVALETLNDMLTFDKIDENKLVVELEDVNPWNFIQETVKPFKINATQVNVQLYIQCAEYDSKWFDSFHIKADKFKLSQVLRNLLSNALKFTPSGGEVKILIEKRRALLSHQRKQLLSTAAKEADCSVRFSVIDTGCGISKENQTKMFGKYVQFNAGALQQGKGSGLGLWISKSLVEMHGGHIGVISDGEGNGSTFFIDLPLHPQINIPAPPSPYGRIWGSDKSRLKPQQSPSVTSRNNVIPMESQSTSQTDNDKAIADDIDIEANNSTPPLKVYIAEQPIMSSNRDLSHKSISRSPKVGETNGEGDVTNISAYVNAAVKMVLAARINITSSPRSYSRFGSGSSAAASFLNSRVSYLTVRRRTPPATNIVVDSSDETQRVQVPALLQPIQNTLSDKNRGTLTRLVSSQHSRHHWGSDTDLDPHPDPHQVDANDTQSHRVNNFNCVHSMDDDNDNLQCEEYALPNAGPSWEGGLRFLIVDDTLTNRKITQKLLTSLGHSVEVAVDGMDFLEKMKKTMRRKSDNALFRQPLENVEYEKPPTAAGGTSHTIATIEANSSRPLSSRMFQNVFDVILMDDNMPNMSGPVATQTVRQMGYRGLIFGVTGNTYAQQIENFIEKGADAVFPKPMNLDELRETVTKKLMERISSN